MALESAKLMDSCVSANLACYEGEWNIPLSFFKHVSTVFVVYDIDITCIFTYRLGTS